MIWEKKGNQVIQDKPKRSVDVNTSGYEFKEPKKNWDSGGLLSSSKTCPLENLSLHEMANMTCVTWALQSFNASLSHFLSNKEKKNDQA